LPEPIGVLQQAKNKSANDQMSQTSQTSQMSPTSSSKIENEITGISILNDTLSAIKDNAKRETVLKNVSGVFYHVLCDCNFGIFCNDVKNGTNYANQKGTKIFFTKDDATKYALKKIEKCENEGVCSMDTGKSFPYVGMIIFTLNFGNVAKTTVSYKDNTDVLVNKNSSITIYNRYENTNKMEAILFMAKNLVDNLKIISCAIELRKNIYPPNGFALLNLDSKVTSADITAIAKLVNGQNEKLTNSKDKDNDSESTVLNFGNNPFGILTEGGSNDELYKDLYIRQKALHIYLKYTKNKNDKYFERKYLDSKKEYLNSKYKYSQYGGDGTYDANEEDEEGDSREEYMALKNEYMNKKNTNNNSLSSKDKIKNLYLQSKLDYLKMKHNY